MTDLQLVGIKGLASAIVLCAVYDYVDIIRCDEPKSEKDTAWTRKDMSTRRRELIEFFKSDWCFFLCGVEGDRILQILHRKSVQERIAKFKLGRPVGCENVNTRTK